MLSVLPVSPELGQPPGGGDEDDQVIHQPQPWNIQVVDCTDVASLTDDLRYEGQHPPAEGGVRPEPGPGHLQRDELDLAERVDPSSQAGGVQRVLGQGQQVPGNTGDAVTLAGEQEGIKILNHTNLYVRYLDLTAAK